MSIPDYVAHGIELNDEPARSLHAGGIIGPAAHRLACNDCMERMTGGDLDDREAINRAVDAQIDLVLAAADGDPRIALWLSLIAFGMAAQQINYLTGQAWNHDR